MYEKSEITPPAKKAPAKRAPRKPKTRAQIEAELRKKIEKETREKIEAEMRESIEAEVRAQFADDEEALKKKLAQSPNPHYDIDVDYEDPDALTIHFLEDGLTCLGRVMYRGQEVTFKKGSPEWDAETNRKGVMVWTLTELEQLDRFGRVLWRRGPWRGKGFDLSDPSLDDKERERLMTIQKEREARLPKN